MSEDKMTECLVFPAEAGRETDLARKQDRQFAYLRGNIR